MSGTTQRVHDHYTSLYASEEELAAVVARFLQRGIDENQRCIYAATPGSQSAVEERLRQAGVDVDQATDAGQLSFAWPNELYLEDEAFDRASTIDGFESVMADADAEGYDGVCVAADMSWLSEYDVDYDEWLEYERRVNELFHGAPHRGLCLYDRSQFPPALLMGALRTHPVLADGDGFHPNPHFDVGADELPQPVDETAPDRTLAPVSDDQSTGRPTAGGDDHLAALARTVGNLTEAGWEETLRSAVGTVTGTLEVPVAAVWTFDEETASLQVESRDVALPALDASTLEERCWDHVWAAFTDREPVTFERSLPDSEDGDGVDRLAGVALPAGERGVLLVADRCPWRPSPEDMRLLRGVASVCESALDHREHRWSLEEQRAELDQQNDHLVRLERANRIFQNVTDVLAEASTRTEILAATCEEVAALEDVEFSWVATYDTATGALERVQAAGAPDGYFDAVTENGEWPDREPTRVAAETRERQVAGNVRDSASMSDWERTALERGVQSVVSFPVSYDDELYGVLTLYLGRPDVFDDEVAGVFDRILALVARTLNGLEQKTALVDDRVTELEFRLHSEDHAAVRFTAELDCEFELVDVAAGSGNSFTVFAESDAEPGAVSAFSADAPAVDDVRLVVEAGGDYLYAFEVSDDCFLDVLLEHSVVPQALTADGETARAVLHVPDRKQVSDFLDMFQRRYPDAELLAKNRRERSTRTSKGFRAELAASLSSRQLETLKTAYHGGYFEWPRENSTEEVADHLDVTHPTVSRHLRAAHRTILSKLFDDE